MEDIDPIDRKILHHLQKDASLSMDALGERVGLSRNACWRRVKTLEERGIIRGQVALIDPVSVDLPLTVFIQIRTASHEANWLERFAHATRSMPEILGVYRMTGDLDYLVHARVRDVPSYDRMYKKLIEKVPLSDVSASFVMEEIKSTTALPVL